jgi:hypothetical protein
MTWRSLFIARVRTGLKKGSLLSLPLTFIAGVYGMNFENMLELHSRYGYYGVWGIMILVAFAMLIFFWRRGWIGSSEKKDEG